MDTKTSLLTTKLFIPTSGRHLVRRPRLETRLKQGCEGALTVICAPAGFGKTTLLSDWLMRNTMPVAWLSLDTQDNDPAQFLTYWIAALQRVDADIGASTLEQLQSPQPVLFESLLLILTDAQSRYSVGLHLALLEDPNKSFTIEQVTSSEFRAQFVPSTQENPNMGTTNLDGYAHADHGRLRSHTGNPAPRTSHLAPRTSHLALPSSWP